MFIDNMLSEKPRKQRAESIFFDGYSLLFLNLAFNISLAPLPE
jgi:hypothetical protein